MTDYNDGNWHGWNGGKCPVHPESKLRAVTEDGGVFNCYADDVAWHHDEAGGNIVAFRVTKQYVEPQKPREFWINEYPKGLHTMHNSKENADT